jgi:hypothetical protein
MAKLSDLIIKIGADTKELNKSLGDSQRRIQATTGNIQKLGKQMSMAFTLPAAILGGTALQAYDKQANAIAQVEAGLRSTGNTAGYTSDQLQKMASDLQSKTIFGDEDILKNATAQLLTFTNISGEQFARTQKAALDLATRLDGDLKGASIQLGKALNDPIANLSALSRSGIQFSDEQKTVIKSLTETGRLAEAQTLILDELEKQYGGSAEAAAKAGMGGIKQLQNSFGDLQEEFGKVISEMLPPLVDFGKNVLASFSGMSDGMKKNIVIITGLVAAVGPMLVILPQLVAGFGMVKVAMLQGVIPAMQKMIAVMAANPILLVTAAVVGLGVAMSNYISFTDAGTKAQQNYNNAMSAAGVEAAKQGAEVARLAKLVGDETVEEEKRIAALQRLQQISPEHFGNLTKESALTSALTDSVKAYRIELMRAAQVKVLTQELEKATARMMELEQEMSKGPSMGDKLLGAIAGPAGSISLMTKRIGDDMGETAATIDLLTEKLSELQTPADIAGTSVAGTATQVKALGTEVKKAAEEVDDFAETFRRSLVEDLKNTPIELPVKPQLKLEQIDPIEEDTTQFDMDFQEDYDKFQKGQEMMREEWNKTAGMTQQFSEMFGSTIGNIVSGSQTAGQAMKSLALSVVKTLIGIAKAAVIANATQTATAAGPAALPMTPILIAGGLSLVEGLLGAIAFADGGIVSGPTLGLVGEYAGAKNNPEVIAPLDKLKSMIGDSGGGRVAVYGRLQGSDINISGERGKLKQNRTR